MHLNRHLSLTQRSRSGLTMPLSGHNVGTYQKRSSNETRQGTLRHSRLGSLSHCGLILALRVELVRELISTLKEKKKRRRGMNCSTFSRNPRTREKATSVSTRVRVKPFLRLSSGRYEKSVFLVYRPPTKAKSR